MATVIDQQPSSFKCPNLGPAPGSDEGVQGPVKIRSMRNEAADWKFAGDLTVEAFIDKFIHATSENSIPNVKECIGKQNSIQDSWFCERKFIAEYEGQPAGLLCMKYHGDPEPRSGDSFDSLGCCDSCGMWFLGCMSWTDVSEGKAYIDHICVDNRFRGKGIGKVMMERAEYEAKARGCSKIFLYVSWTNRARNLYERQGFTVTESSCLFGFIWCTMGVTGFYKMEKDL